MSDNEGFKRSRIYAEGWNAANKLSSEERDNLDLERMAVLNPYLSEADRSRWTQGFAKALGD
jgi:hypothetical protein